MTALNVAIGLAETLITQLEPYCTRIQLAGSCRRRKPEVKDIELVAIPKWEAAGLFAEGMSNSLNLELDRMVAGGSLLRGETLRADGSISRAWGPTYRKAAVLHDGHKINVDIFQCQEINWGNTLLIRTGPWEFSKWYVTELLRKGYKHEGGYVLSPHGTRLEVLDETRAFALIGLAYQEPSVRIIQGGRGYGETD